MPKGDWGKQILRSRTYKIIILCVWLVILGACLLCRDQFSVESVLQASPQNMLLAALFMMVLFALKSMSIFIFSGILFAANGILFPLPAAIGLNILGTGIMVSLPYWVGKKVGKDMIDRIVCKYPRVELLWNASMEYADESRIHSFFCHPHRQCFAQRYTKPLYGSRWNRIYKISGGEHPWNASIHHYVSNYGNEHNEPWFTGVYCIDLYPGGSQHRFHWRFLDLLQEKSGEGKG